MADLKAFSRSIKNESMFLDSMSDPESPIYYTKLCAELDDHIEKQVKADKLEKAAGNIPDLLGGAFAEVMTIYRLYFKARAGAGQGERVKIQARVERLRQLLDRAGEGIGYSYMRVGKKKSRRRSDYILSDLFILGRFCERAGIDIEAGPVGEVFAEFQEAVRDRKPEPVKETNAQEGAGVKPQRGPTYRTIAIFLKAAGEKVNASSVKEKAAKYGFTVNTPSKLMHHFSSIDDNFHKPWDLYGTEKRKARSWRQAYIEAEHLLEEKDVQTAEIKKVIQGLSDRINDN